MARFIPCYRVLISATSKKEAIEILDLLTEKKLVAGGLITSGHSQYWWEGKRVKKIYWNISSFTRKQHRARLIVQVKAVHRDEVPVIAFFKIDDGNSDFLTWIQESTS